MEPDIRRWRRAPASTWSELKGFASAPSGGDIEYHRVFMDKPDVCRCFYVEKFTGTEAYNRPFWSHSVLDANFLNNLWREPVPFDLSTEYGLAIAHMVIIVGCQVRRGVWRAPLTVQSLDLTADVLQIRQEMDVGSGKLSVELRNDAGQYASPGEGGLSALDFGCQLEVSPGYATAAGNEASAGCTFWLEALEHTSAVGKASLILYASDAWSLIENWRARHQFRWNKDSEEMPVKQILEFVLARAGLKVEIRSQSSVITGFYPDFAIHPGNRGNAIIRDLLSYVPDGLFIEGNKAYLLNPQSSDTSEYSYGSGHSVFEGRHLRGAWKTNRVQVEGYDPAAGETIVVDSFLWAQIGKLYDRLSQIEDRNLGTVARAAMRGESYLREAEIESAGGLIRIPVNCEQQLYDVIDITDSRAGLDAKKRRVKGITLVYDTRRGGYESRLLLGEA